MSLEHLAASLCGLMVVATSGVALAGGRPFTPQDLVAMERVSDPQPSPDGQRVAFVVTTMDLEANRGRRALWLAAVDGSWARPLTSGTANDSAPRWAGNDTLYFLSDRSGSSQVWRLPLEGGEARPVTDLPLEINALKVSPRGDALVVAMEVFPDCPDPIAGTVRRMDERAREKASGKVYDRLFVRHWDTWEDGRRSHLFRIDLAADGSSRGDPVDLMRGVEGNCPSKPFGDEGDFSISPDGTWLVYAAKVVPGSEQAWSTDSDLWAVKMDGSSPVRCLTESDHAWDGTPAFSPDGTTLAYLAMERPGFESDRRRVVRMDWPGGEPQVLTEAWDRSPSDLAWAADGTALYASADNIGNHSIFRIDATTGAVTAVVSLHSNTSPRPLLEVPSSFPRTA